MRPLTEISETPVRVGGNSLIREASDDFLFKGLIVESSQAFLTRQLADNERGCGRGALSHPRLNLRQVIGSQCSRQQEVVIEAVLDGRTDAELCFRKEGEYGLRHHVRGGMPHPDERVVLAVVAAFYDLVSFVRVAGKIGVRRGTLLMRHG